jgi:hypothetical protein
MSGVIASVENDIVSAVKAALGRAVRIVDTLPNGFTAGELEQRMRQAPAVFVAFLGGRFRDDSQAVLDAMFGVFFLGQTSGDEKAARLGTPTQIGAYQMFELAVPAVHGLKTDYGCLYATDASNLFSGEIDRQGLALYSAAFRVPLSFPKPDPSGPFGTLFVQYQDRIEQAATGDPASLPVPDNQTVAEDLLQLGSQL